MVLFNNAELTNLNSLVVPYKKVVDAFKKRFDVQNGTALGYRKGQDPSAELLLKDKPKGIGDGLATTGWCVSASQALLLDPIFQILIKNQGALAKLVSIDIKEQYYGSTYSGHQNKWHTAILVSESGVNFIIDITCAQFGNNFVGKTIWDFKTWEKTFRSPLDAHKIVDWENNELSFLPIGVNVVGKNASKILVEYELNNITTITDSERSTISDFLIDKIEVINKKILVGNINKLDFKYIEQINKILQEFVFVQYTGKSKFFAMQFDTKIKAKNWISKLAKNSFITQQYIVLSDSVKDSCVFYGIDENDINKEKTDDKTFIVMEFTDSKGLEICKFLNNTSLIIPYGIKLEVNPETDIINGGKILSADPSGIFKQTNTIFIRCKN